MIGCGEETDIGRTHVMSVIVPVYNNAGSLGDLMERLASLDLPRGVDLEAVFVIDGSPDDSETVLRALLKMSSVTSTMVVLSRNFGSFAAIRTGLQHATGDYFAVMAADLQEPPELVVDFIRELSTGEVDVVLGKREGRDDPRLAKRSAGLFWWLYRRLVQSEMPEGGVDVFGCNEAARSTLLQFPEANSSLVGQLIWLGLRRRTVPYTRAGREVGKSGWTFRKKFRYMTDSIFSFTELPIHVLLLVGAIASTLVAVAGVVVFAAWASGLITVAGYTPLLLSVLFIGAFLIFSMGVVGSYVWRTYDNTKQRPLTIVQSTERFNGGDHS